MLPSGEQQARRGETGGSEPRDPVRTGPDRAEDAPEPLLSGAALLGLRDREAVDAGRASRRQGRGRLGRGLHRVRAVLSRVRRGAADRRALLGRGRHARLAADDRCRPRARGARGARALSRRRAHREQPDEGAGGRAEPARQRPRGARGPQGDGGRRHRARAAPVGGGSGPRARLRLRHRLRVRGARVPPDAVPLALLQQADGWLRRSAEGPRPVLARNPRGRARCGRRRLRDRDPDRRGRPRTRRHPPRRSVGVRQLG